MNLKYTICFCRYRHNILMIYRSFPPNQHLWNGLGGKIEPGEDPKRSVIRELQEEAGLDLLNADLSYAGIVSWSYPTGSPVVGMYAFIADYADDSIDPQMLQDRQTEEGMLAWKPQEWVYDMRNSSVVCNIPYVLPPMLANHIPKDYYFTFTGNTVDSFQVKNSTIMI